MSQSNSQSRPVVTRFAPSPTGFLHIGSARTALFNWLFAKANGGKMLLRIEDTDRQRSTDAATAAIFEGMEWLGLNHDGDSVSQFSRADRHREIARQLLENGRAYYCYASKDELDAMRTKARERAEPMQFLWRDRDAFSNTSLAPDGVDPVIRLKTPLEGNTVVEDVVQGDVTFANKDLDDMVLVRSDGNPTYMHAVVVDDNDMGVTHIIRGDDHLTNAARQILLYDALEWPVPVMAHIPLIHGADGAKLSKRHGALGVDAYRAMGYLPKALLNYLARLGWSHGDDEIISVAQMIKWFDLTSIGKGASRFDFAKLENLNGHYIRTSEDSELIDVLLADAPLLQHGQHLTQTLNENQLDLLKRGMRLIKEKAKNLNDLALGSQFMFSQIPVALDEKAKKILNAEAIENLKKLVPWLEKADTWSVDCLTDLVRDFCEHEGIKLGKIAQPIRCAIAGTPSAPGVFEVMELFGRDQVIGRIKDQVNKI